MFTGSNVNSGKNFLEVNNMKRVIYNGETGFLHPCSDPSVLCPGKVYTVVKEEVSDWHTEYTLDGVDGEFNSVWFNTIMPTYFAIGNYIPRVGYIYRCNKIIMTDSGCYMQGWRTSTVQEVEFVGENTYKVTTYNSIYLVTIR